MNSFRKTYRRNTPPAGVAVVELAVCLPVLVLLAFASIEATSMIYLKQSLKITAYEGVRISMVTGATNGQVTQQCELILTNRRINGGSVSISPDVETASAGTPISVTVSAPCRSNGFFTSLFYSNSRFEESAHMMKEN